MNIFRDLSVNALTEITVGMFRGLEKLEKLDLQTNAISKILPNAFAASQSKILTQRSFFSKWRKIWIRDVFWSQHLGCWGQNTSRIQNKGDYATLCLQAVKGHTQALEGFMAYFR